MTAMKYFMEEVGKHNVLTPQEEQAKFQRLDALKDELIRDMNMTAVFYNKIPSILFLLADGYEAVKNIIQPHKHDLKTKQLTAHVIETLQQYQILYQQKVIQKKPELKQQLDELTLALAFEPTYIEQLANEIRMYNDGDSLVDMHQTDDLLLVTQYSVATKLKEIKALRSTIVSCNLRLVVNLARKMYKENGPVSLEDLIQEGNIGLMNAVERFDVQQGNRFSTLATWWINSSITRSVQNKARMIRVPVSVQDHLNKAIHVQRTLQAKLKRPPKDNEIATALGISIDRWKELQESMTSMTSLDSPASSDEDNQLTLGDIIADAAQSADVSIYCEQIQQHVQAALSKLPEREREVIKMRFGFDDEEMTLGEIAAVMGCTKPSVMNYENRAKLKIHRYLCESLQYLK